MGEAKRRADHLLALHAAGRVGGGLSTDVMESLLLDLGAAADSAAGLGVKRDVVAVAMLAFAVDALIDTFGEGLARDVALSAVARRVEMNRNQGKATRP